MAKAGAFECLGFANVVGAHCALNEITELAFQFFSNQQQFSSVASTEQATVVLFQ